MTQEEKELLLKDLCGRAPYGVKIKVRSSDIRTVRAVDIVEGIVHFVENDTISPFGLHIEDPLSFRQKVKPYLRPMSSMTEEEKNEYALFYRVFSCSLYERESVERVDWLNSHHFDYRGLIPMGLALEAPEGMYFQQKSDDELKKDVAKKLIDALIYDNDYVNWMTPLDESRHYGNWIDYVAKSVTFPDRDKEWWNKEDRIDIFAIGDYDEKEDLIKKYPKLRELDTALSEYYDYLNDEFKFKTD